MKATKARTRSRKIQAGKERQLIGRVEVRMMDKPNPDWRQDLHNVPGFPKEIRTAVNMRESPIVWMLAHDQVSTTQAMAADHFRKLYEAAGGADLKAMDTTKEPVDGGGFPDIITDRKMQAGRELSNAYDLLGIEGYRLVVNVCGECLWLKDIEYTKRRQWEAGKRLKNCLNMLAIHWGYQSPKTRSWRKAS